MEAWLKAESDVDRLKGGIMGVASAGRGGPGGARSVGVALVVGGTSAVRGGAGGE